MNRYLSVLLLAAACGLVAGCGKLAEVALQGNFEEVGAKAVAVSSSTDIRAMFEQANAACPRRMDEFTTLESVKMIDDRRVEFHYKVNNEGKQLARRFDKVVLRNAAVQHMKGNKMAVAIAQRDLSIEHIYQDVFGGHILSYTINRQVLAGNPNPLGSEQANPFDVTLASAGPEAVVTVDSGEVDSDASQPDAAEVDSASSEPPAVEEPPQPMMPRKYQPALRSIDNPAGVQSNPFLD